MSLRIRVRLYATLAQHRVGARPGIPFEVHLAEGETVADLVARLELPTAEVKMSFVNGRARPRDWILHTGDEVGLFPPVGGG